MLARITTNLACTQGELWDQIGRPQSLQFVASPLLTFTAIEPGALDGDWEFGRDYQLQLHLVGFIPLGRHTIRLTRVDRDHNTIQSRESGLLARVWNHTICFQEIKVRIHQVGETVAETKKRPRLMARRGGRGPV